MSSARLTYRKNQKGDWVIYGPASALVEGALVTVYTKAGELKHERITSVGRPFMADGQRMAYGYIADTKPAKSTGRSYRGYDSSPGSGASRYGRSTTGRCPTGGDCDSFGIACWHCGTN